MAQKKIPKPAWYKNTYFWIAGILFILFIVGLTGGDPLIRDPGQKREGYLWLLYLVASAVMLLNGFLSHSQTVQHYNETVGEAQAGTGEQAPAPSIGSGSVPTGIPPANLTETSIEETNEK